MNKSQFSAVAGVACLLATAFFVVQSMTGDSMYRFGALIAFILTVIFGVGALVANLPTREVVELEAAFNADSFERPTN